MLSPKSKLAAARGIASIGFSKRSLPITLEFTANPQVAAKVGSNTFRTPDRAQHTMRMLALSLPAFPLPPARRGGAKDGEG